jgi:hypothetical protein
MIGLMSLGRYPWAVDECSFIVVTNTIIVLHHYRRTIKLCSGPSYQMVE